MKKHLDYRTEIWRTAPDGFPAMGPMREKWKFWLHYAVMAPSSHNSQPWLFHVYERQLDLYADRTRSCRVVDPRDRELIMSCGAALFHLKLALKHFGYFGSVEVLPDPAEPDLLARVRTGYEASSSPEEAKLFHAMAQRRTNRQPFRNEPVPMEALAALERAARDESAWLHVVENEATRLKVAELIAIADRQQWSNKRFRLELAAWVHPNRSERRDGIPGYSHGVDDLLSCVEPLAIRTFDMGDGQAAKDREIALYSPVLAVLATEGDSEKDWMAAGQALAKILLQARADNLWASFLNQPIELPELRQSLGRLTRRAGRPQACLRLGYAQAIKPTPRRPVEDVLI